MKKMLLLAVAFVCAACEKDNFTMPESDLIGTYWHETRYVASGGHYGDDYYVDTDEGILLGHNAAIWHFAENNQLVFYLHTIYPPEPSNYWETSYQYDPVQRKLTIGDSQYDLLQFTSEQIVYTYVESDGKKITRYYRPFTPSDAFFGKDKDMFTLSEDKLAGTYWSWKGKCYTGYRYGEFFCSNGLIEEDPLVYSFSQEGTVTVYGRDSTYKTMVYTYDKERHLLEFGGSTYQLLRLIPEQMVWSYAYKSEQTTLFNNLWPFEPNDLWFEIVSGYEDRTGEE